MTKSFFFRKVTPSACTSLRSVALHGLRPLRGLVRSGTLLSIEVDKGRRDFESFRSLEGSNLLASFEALSDVVPAAFDRSGGRESHPDPEVGDLVFFC